MLGLKSIYVSKWGPRSRLGNQRQTRDRQYHNNSFCTWFIYYFPEERLANFVVGMTMAHPDTFPYRPDTSPVVPFLKVCYQHQGSPDTVYVISCTQPVWGRVLVITRADSTEMPIGEVIVNERKCKSYLHNGACQPCTVTPYSVESTHLKTQCWYKLY